MTAACNIFVTILSLTPAHRDWHTHQRATHMNKLEIKEGETEGQGKDFSSAGNEKKKVPWHFVWQKRGRGEWVVKCWGEEELTIRMTYEPSRCTCVCVCMCVRERERERERERARESEQERESARARKRESERDR